MQLGRITETRLEISLVGCDSDLLRSFTATQFLNLSLLAQALQCGTVMN